MTATIAAPQARAFYQHGICFVEVDPDDARDLCSFLCARGIFAVPQQQELADGPTRLAILNLDAPAVAETVRTWARAALRQR